jgi:L-lactate dehydrogenase complex protein LldG
MAARENILGRIRARRGKPEAVTGDDRDAIRSHVAAHPHSPRPPSDWDPEIRFRERAQGLGSTLDEADAASSVPGAVARYLSACSLPPAAVCWPEFASFDWLAAGVQIAVRPARDSDLVGVTGAFCAIAETGTVVTFSGASTPGTVSLLPETHITIVSRARIVRGMEEAWALMRQERAAPPRAISFISGPSRTADIEQTVTLGAHGPYRVHIILVR